MDVGEEKDNLMNLNVAIPEEKEKEESTSLSNTSSPTGMTVKKFERVSEEQDREISILKNNMKINIEKLGTEHPTTLSTIEALADIQYDTLNFKEAEPLYAWALEGRRKCLGYDHTQASILPLCNYLTTRLALSLCRNRKYRESESLLLSSLKIVEAEVGTDHEQTNAIVEGLGICYEELGNAVLSEGYYSRALDYRRRNDGFDHPQTQWVVETLCKMFLSQGRLDDAAELTQECLDYCMTKVLPISIFISISISMCYYIYFIQNYVCK